MKATLREIAAWLLRHDNYAVISHIRPDGDAFGCMFAMTLALRSVGKNAFAACSDPMDRQNSFLPLAGELHRADDLPFEPETLLVVDVSSPQRTGDLAPLFDAAKHVVVIDHHLTDNVDAELCYVDSAVAACAEILTELLDEMGIALNAQLSTCLYTALSTDCGNFSYRNTTPRTMMTAAKLIAGGADVDDLTRRLYRTRTEAETRLIGAALSAIQMSPKRSVAMIAMTPEMYEVSMAKPQDAHDIVNYLNEMEGVRVGILLDTVENGVKASFRGSAGTDVASFAARFGGGGHREAAGATIKGIALREAAERLMREAIAYIEE